MKLLEKVPRLKNLPNFPTWSFLGDMGQLGLTCEAGTTLEMEKHRANGSQMGADYQKLGKPSSHPMFCRRGNRIREGKASQPRNLGSPRPGPPPCLGKCQVRPKAQGLGRGPAQSCQALRAGPGPNRMDLKH